MVLGGGSRFLLLRFSVSVPRARSLRYRAVGALLPLAECYVLMYLLSPGLGENPIGNSAHFSRSHWTTRIKAMSFQPLPDGYTLRSTRHARPSLCPICEGRHQGCDACEYKGLIPQLGLFTILPRAKGDTLGTARLETVDHLNQTRTARKREPLSLWINCNDKDPNCHLQGEHVGDVDHGIQMDERSEIWLMTLVASRDIGAGEELDLSYTLTEYGKPGERPWT